MFKVQQPDWSGCVGHEEEGFWWKFEPARAYGLLGMTRRSYPDFALFTVYFLVFGLLKSPIGTRLENFILDSSSGSQSCKISTIHQNQRWSKIRFFGQKWALFRPIFEASWRPGFWCQPNGNCTIKKLQHFSTNLPSFK